MESRLGDDGATSNGNHRHKSTGTQHGDEINTRVFHGRLTDGSCLPVEQACWSRLCQATSSYSACGHPEM